MRADPWPDNAGEDGELLHPAYWLVTGLEWHGDGELAEAALAVAPGLIPRDAIGADLYQVLGCADLYQDKHQARVVFLTDLTRMFTDAGTSWADLGVDWNRALNELRHGPYPAMFLTITRHAHLLICDPAQAVQREQQDGPAGDERERARQAITRQLAAGWPPYLQAIIRSGRVRRAG